MNNLIQEPLQTSVQVADATYWSVFDDNSIEIVLADKNTYCVTDKEISLQNPLLPVVIRAIDKWQKPAGYRYISAHVVQETLRLMSSPYALTYHDGAHHVQIVRVNKLELSQMDTTMVEVRGTKLYLEYVEHENQSIPMIVDSLWCHTGVPKTAISENNPDWQERLALSATLDLTLAEKLPFVFPPSIKPGISADLGQVNFQ